MNELISEPWFSEWTAVCLCVQKVLKLFKNSPPEVRLTLCRPSPGTNIHSFWKTYPRAHINLPNSSVSAGILPCMDHFTGTWAIFWALHGTGVDVMKQQHAFRQSRRWWWTRMAIAMRSCSDQSTDCCWHSRKVRIVSDIDLNK